MPATLEMRPPQLVGSRQQARSLFEEPIHNLHGSIVILNCSRLEVATPSFMDEVIRVVLVESLASKLVLESPTRRIADYAERSATLRVVSDRLSIRS